MSFKKGMKVIVLQSDHTIDRGVIRRVDDFNNVAVVDLDTGEVMKVPFSNLGIAPEEPEEQRQAFEKTEITITPDEFKKTSSRVLSNEIDRMNMGESGIIIKMAFTIILSKIHKALFTEEVNND